MPIDIFNFLKKNKADTVMKPYSNTLPDFSHPLERERLEDLKGSKLFNIVALKNIKTFDINALRKSNIVNLDALKIRRIFNIILNFFGKHYANFTTIAQIPDRYFPVTSKTFPRLYDLYKIACEKLEIQKDYTLFCKMDYTRNAKTIGTDENCVIVIDSSCLEDFSDRQIIALLGRELGHIKMKHITYLNAFDMIDDLIWSIPLGSKLFSPALVNGVKGLFLEWLLVAEYTADRAAAIAADGIQPVMQNHLMTSGIETAEECQDYNFYTQISFSQNLSNFDRAAQIVLIGTLKTFPIPFVIPRMQELEKWATSEECAKNFPKVYNDHFKTPKTKNISKSLSKGQKVELTKNNSTLKKILIGLGWNINNGDNDFDLDAAAFLLQSNGKVSDDDDFIFYGNLRHKSGAIEHMGDNLTGAGEGDDEQIKIFLDKLPDDIERIAFTVTIYDAEQRKQTFGQISNSFIRVVNLETNEELIRYDLGEHFSVETAIVVGEVYRYKGKWKFNAVGSGFKGGLAALCKNYGVDVKE